MQATDVVIAVCFLHIAGSLANQPPLYPRLSEEPESFVLSRSGVNVTLKCRSSAGRIRPTWFHNGKLIHESDVYMLLDTGDLFIKEFEPGTQEGRYYCEVSVPDGGTVRSRTAVLQRKVVKPELLIPPTNLTVYEGNPAYFYCTPETNVDLEQLEGNRFPGCTNGGRWNKDKCPLNESEEMLFPPDNSLFIKNATLSHPVEFCCNVKMPKCAYLNTVPSRGLTHTPTIALQPKTKTVETGETVVIPCIVKSVPRSEIDWLKPNGKQVKRKSQHRVSVLSDNMLVIKNALTRDSGVYHCKASNTVGQVTMNVTIIVIAVPKVNHTFNDTLRNQTPGPVKIVCPIIEPHYRKSVKKTNATPSFQTVWLKDGTEIKESDSIDILQPSNDTLYIKDAQIMDSGMYQCIVENIYGSNVQTTFRLDVINPSAQGPSRVRDLKLTYIPGNFQLSWSSPEHLGCRTRQCTIQNYSIKILPTFGSDLKGSDDVVGRVTSVYLYSKSRPYLYGSGEYNFEVTAQNSDNFWGQPGRTSSKVLELPKEHDIDIVETTSTSVRITYRLPKDDIASSSCKFCVHYNPTDKYQRSSQCLDPCLGDGPFPEYAKALQTMEIKALKSNTTYRFYAEVTYSTRKALSYWISCTTGLEAPSETPRLLQVVRINSTAFIIDFMGIHNSGLRNLSFYYQLNYFNGTEPIPIVKFHPQNMAETANGTIRIVIDGSALGLAAWMDYELSMQSCCNSNNCKEWAKQSKCGRRTNSEMPGVFADFKKFCLFSCNCSRQHSQRVIIRPHDIDFEPVDDVQVTDISTESAHIAWQPVNSSLQLVYGYRVNVKSDDPMKPSIVKNTTLSHLSVTGLQAYTDYSVTVSVLTFDRQKAVAQSKPLRFQTEIDVYAAPHNVTIERGHQLNSAVISWKFFSSDQATVFNVSCCETQKCISPQYSATSNNITIDGLLPHEEYAFRVSRIIGNRQGKWSKCVSYTTPNFRPPPEIRGYCVESDGIHLTCFVSNCPDKCQPLLNVSICWSNQAHCIYSLFDRKADERGPIGGGEGYANAISPLPDPVSTLDDLLDALAQAKPGDVIGVDGKAEIDCTERVYIESLVLEIPEGVTLAGDRGVDGSPGGMILSDTFDTRPLIQVTGPDVRVTGLRIKGPNPKRCLEHHNRSFREGRGHEYYYKFPISNGIETRHPGLEVDNCEVAGWSHGAIYLGAGYGHHIHHNFIHHNQYNGLGYGVSHDEAFSLIEYNRFDYNRHSLAGTGRSGSGYEARHNVEIGESLSHCFDMHGGRDRKDGTDVAGTWMKVHHNTFRCPQTAVVVRGIPEEGVDVHHNWLYQRPDELSVRSDGRTRVRNNAYGLSDPVLVANADVGQ